jgi:hypothetical protein
VLPPGITSALYVVVILFCLNAAFWKIERGLLYLVSPFFLLFVLGIAWVFHHPTFSVMKDAWYLIKVVLAIGAGYLLMRHINSFQELCKLVVIAAVLGSVIHYTQVVMNYDSGMSLMELRDKGVGGSLVIAIGLALLIAYPHYLRMSAASYSLSCLLCAGSLLVSMSRTSVVSFLVFLAIAMGWGRMNKKALIVIALSCAVLTALMFSNVVTISTEDTTFAGKLANSLGEIMVSDYDDPAEINRNWRGFESSRALVSYLNGDLINLAVGQGFGATVDLGFFIPLGPAGEANWLRYIPITHNGYLYLLLKYGAVGLLIYMYFVFRLILAVRWGATQQRADMKDTGRLISALGWIFLLTTLVITGVFNISVLDPALIMLGAVVGCFKMQERSYMCQK